MAKTKEDPIAQQMRFALTLLLMAANSMKSTQVTGSVNDDKGNTWRLKFEKEEPTHE